MQRYKIEIPQSVKDKIETQALYIAQDKPQVALKWYDTIYKKIQTLNHLSQPLPQSTWKSICWF